jgi:hypothetical protein
MRITLFILVLAATRTFAIEVLPSVENCAPVFKGEVLSEELVQTITNRSAIAELYAARIKVTSVIKQDTKLASEVIVYYVYNNWQVCPRSADLTPKQKATFYCYRRDYHGKTNALIVPSGSFVESYK